MTEKINIGVYLLPSDVERLMQKYPEARSRSEALLLLAEDMIGPLETIKLRDASRWDVTPYAEAYAAAESNEEKSAIIQGAHDDLTARGFDIKPESIRWAIYRHEDE